MKCHGFKGGIGSSSRIVKYDDKELIYKIDFDNVKIEEINGKKLIFITSFF